MNTRKVRSLLLAVVACVTTGLFCSSAGAADGSAKPLKVYIMAGQSNMQGHARVSTFEHIGMDPATVPILKKMVGADGKPRVFDKVWISTLGCARQEKVGKLTVGFGGERAGPKIGPELTFGIYMQEQVKEPILIIKTAWGGKSLSVDFRPPSAGPWEFGAGAEIQADEKSRAIKEARLKASGHYYRLMIGHVKKVLADINKVYPGYDADQGYQVAGFVWFQGCNDFGDAATYPNPGKPGGYDEYSRLVACLIRDLRKEFKAPDMRAVIGVLGINGSLEGERVRQIEPRHIPWLREFRKAMAAPAAMPEFKGTVAAVYTQKYWEPKLEELQGRWARIKARNNELKQDKSLSRAERDAAIEKFKATVYNPQEWKLMEVGVSNAAYHYMGSAKIMSRIGKAFADAMVGMSESESGAAGRQIAPGQGRLTGEPAGGDQALFAGKKSLYAKKYDMYRDGKNIVVVPEKVATGKPWVWRARFFNAFPQFDIAMLNKGYHVVYCDVGGLLGNPEAVSRWNEYYKVLTEEHGLAKKVILEGLSRGGMIIYKWAIANPDKVAAIYGDAPVMDLKSWPGFKSRTLHRAYKFESEEDFTAYKGNPVDNLKTLADARIPIIHVVGDKDEAAPRKKSCGW